MPGRRWCARLAGIQLGLLSGVLLLGVRHPFHVSVCQVDHNPQTQALEITFRLFTDDLEEALLAQGTGRLMLGDSREAPAVDRYLFNYLKHAVVFVVNGDTARFQYVGRETETDVTWCYVEILKIAQVKKIAITNRLLHELFEDQINLVHVKAGGKLKSLQLRRGHATDTLEF
ncbi:MAG: hypothetical protein ONB48_16980 [candidate division KSB1 bacterium]|nr:hypothetical protein [candidate division KSB1 bacterium]MDZ7275172.1 hypothetical protein [candidate division KSB1 bacterium]MDZ7287341.1 hypothetical protein [candidate division KSB1 bacterium]MDZ7299455.1 hypothetical protein [candidate division KSB1 bacterium]MDZ7305499.1 hypothetical protein [candidate division KSB1 bacterium]